MKELERRIERLEDQVAEPQLLGPDLPESDEELAAKIIGLATRVLGAGVWTELGLTSTPSENEFIAQAGALQALAARL
jgi:hypothetical protein